MSMHLVRSSAPKFSSSLVKRSSIFCLISIGVLQWLGDCSWFFGVLGDCAFDAIVGGFGLSKLKLKTLPAPTSLRPAIFGSNLAEDQWQVFKKKNRQLLIKKRKLFSQMVFEKFLELLKDYVVIRN